MTSIVKMGTVMAVMVGVGLSAGCGGNAASSRPSATPASADGDEYASGLMEHHRYHHGGVTHFIAMSLETLGVAPEQQAAIDKIRTELGSAMAPERTAEEKLLATLADGLAGANLDAAGVGAAVAQVAKAAAAVHDDSAGALNQLHAVLTPPERAALVDKVDAHWAIWQKENAEEVPAPNNTESGHLATLASDLDLTADQVEKIRAAFAGEAKAGPPIDRQEIAAHVHAFDDAFRSETFDARLLTTGTAANTGLTNWGAAHLAHVVETLAPLLTPDQRATLASKLREHATHGPIAEVNS
ncbi:MAG TPA: Spy/CpxP family protein refolding chaperone [Polyangia bacterium]|nr:Spy/CpxP family protein refolding chaperone [Polyangia bacterium]